MNCLNCKKEIKSKVYISEVFENKCYLMCESCGCIHLYDKTDNSLDDMIKYENTSMQDKIIKDYTMSILLNKVEMHDLEIDLDEEGEELTEEEINFVDAIVDNVIENNKEIFVGKESPNLTKEETVKNLEDIKPVDASERKVYTNADEISTIEIPQDIQHQIEADFCEYLIISSDFGDADMQVFAGSKKELNNFIEQNKFHSVPKVYEMKQLKVEVSYKVK